MSYCLQHYGWDDAIYCEKIRDDLNKCDFNFEVKCKFVEQQRVRSFCDCPKTNSILLSILDGETGMAKLRAQDVYMKQKHRLILERRNKQKEAQNKDSTL